MIEGCGEEGTPELGSRDRAEREHKGGTVLVAEGHLEAGHAVTRAVREMSDFERRDLIRCVTGRNLDLNECAIGICHASTHLLTGSTDIAHSPWGHGQMERKEPEDR